MSKLLFVLISLISTTAFTADVVDLYESRSPIVNQSVQERQLATVKILHQVLLKVIGDKTALAATDLSPLLEQAEQFVSQYAYQGKLTQSGSPQDLVLRFNESALNQAMYDLGLPVWGKLRPESVIWLSIDGVNKQKMVGTGDDYQRAYQLIKQASQQRGLPLLFPLMDLQEQQQLQFSETEKLITKDTGLVKASDRYGADIVVLARLTVDKTGTIINWQWLKQGELGQYQSRGSMAVAIAQGIDQIATVLANELASVEQQALKRDYQMVVSGINDFSDYSRVQSYLSGLRAVSEVNIVSLKDKQLELRLELLLGLTLFNQVINDDGLLEPETLALNSDTIYYRLRP
jgi:hypothetical protein